MVILVIENLSQIFFKKKPSWVFTLFKALEVGLYHNLRLPSIFASRAFYSHEAHGDHTYRIKHWNDHHLKRFVIHLRKKLSFFWVKLRSLLSYSWFQKELWTSILTLFFFSLSLFLWNLWFGFEIDFSDF